MKLSNTVEQLICEHGQINENRSANAVGKFAFAAYAQGR
jgi:hypothetical protein